jgi:hypothetical protein
MATHYNLRRKKPVASFEFLKLSGEMRNEIYTYVVVANETIRPLWRDGSWNEKKKLGITRTGRDQEQPAITRVSSQLRQEALPLYYANNVFDLSTRWHWTFPDMRSVPAAQRVLIQEEELEIEVVHPRQLPISSFLATRTKDFKNIQAIEISCPFHLKVKILHDFSNIEVSYNRPTMPGQIITKVKLEAARQILLGLAGKSLHEDFSGLHLIKIASRLNTERREVLKAANESLARPLRQGALCSCYSCYRSHFGIE